MKRSILTSLTALVTCIFTVYAGVNEWTKIGPEGALIVAIDIDPQNSDLIYASGLNGVFKSTNRGANWRPVNSGLPTNHVFGVAIDPKTTSTLYARASARGLYKSADAGEHWEKLPLPGFDLSVPAIDPRNPSTMYAGQEDSLFRSLDGGRTWNRLPFSFRIGCCAVWPGIVIDQHNPSTLYAWTADMDGCCSGLWRSTDDGVSWVKLLDSVSGFIDVRSGFHIWAFDIRRLHLDSQHAGTMYAEIGGLLKSTDGGTNWTWMENPDKNPDWTLVSLVVDPQSGVLYAGMTPISGIGGSRVFRSNDGGETWSALPYPGLGDRRLDRLVIDPNDPATLYALSMGDVLAITFVAEEP